METANQIRNRLTNEKKSNVLKFFSLIFGIIAIVLGVLIYMKKDENATFLKENFNVETSFKDTNTKIDAFLASLFTFKNVTNKDQLVNQNVIYLPSEQSSYFTCEGELIPSLSDGIVYQVSLEEDNSYTILVEYDNSLIVCYYQVYEPLVKVYDQIKKGDYIASYNTEFKALFKRNGKLITYEQI